MKLAGQLYAILDLGSVLPENAEAVTAALLAGGADLLQLRAKGNPIPAIALTAFARAEEKRRALEAGYHAHLAKPVNPVHLARAIARLRSAARVEAAREA